MSSSGWANRLSIRTARALGRDVVRIRTRAGPVYGHTDDRVLLPHLARNGAWAGTIVASFVSHISRAPADTPWRFLDIGACYGTVGLAIVREAERAGRVVACDFFEPDPSTFALLRRTLAHATPSARSGLRAHNVALGAPVGPDRHVATRRSSGNGGDTRTCEPGPGERGVPLVRLDAFEGAVGDLATNGRILAKIDVQGAEPEVLEGGAITLARADMLAVEFWPYGLRARGHDPADFIARLLALAGDAQVGVCHDEHAGAPPDLASVEDVRPILSAFACSRNEVDDQLEVVIVRGSAS